MKKIVLTLLSLLSLTLSMSAAVDGKFQFTYPQKEQLPYNLGYQYSVYDLKESDIEGWRVMYLNESVTLTYHITSEEDKTVEVVFDPSYLELKDIVIPGTVIDPDTKTEYTVTAIGKMAFDDCPEIRSVIMCDSITRIEDYAFNMCENKVLHKIGYVKFSKNLTHIGDYAFKNCHNLTTGHYTEGNQWPLFATDFVTNVDYPIYGYGGRQSGLENYLLLPAAVEHIGKHAFEGCYFINIEKEKNKREYGLSKVKIPNPSCVIDDYAFAGCQFLELITIGEELTSSGLTYSRPNTDKKGRIGDFAFANCNLMRLDIPASIESIGENAFINCFHRSREHTPRSNEGRVYLDNLQWFYPKSLFDNYDSWWANWNNGSFPLNRTERTNAYLDEWHTNTVTIHSAKTNIGINAFANNPQLERVIIDGEAGEMGHATFKNCSNLKKVNLPKDLTKVISSMFMNCTALDTISIPDNVTEIGDSAFYGCKNLSIIELPSKLKKVNPYTFYECNWLSLTDLPDDVSSIGNHAFYGCANITSFNIPSSVTSIGDYAFAGCYRHEGIRVGDVYRKFYGLTQVTIGDGVTSIGAHAFDGCRHLGQIELGENVTTIGDYAFQNCMSCPVDNCDVVNSEVTLPNSLTTMGIGAFQGCSHLPSIDLGKDMTELPDFAFAYCSDLSSIGKIENITFANDNAFIGCYSLEDFGSLFDSREGLILEDGILYNHDHTEVISALPNITCAEIVDGVIKIHDGAFANCGVLDYVVFPETLQEIGSRAFENCTALTSAELVDVKMGDFVYAGCTAIDYVVLSSDFNQDLQDNWFAGCVNMQGIDVDGENDRYSSYDGVLLMDKEGTTILRAPSGITDIDWPEGVIKIGDYAFSNCFNLDDVTIPSTVTHIGAHAFDGCYLSGLYWGYEYYWGLSKVTFLNPAVTIGAYAFNNCKNLSSVTWDGESFSYYSEGEYEGDFESYANGTIGAYAFNDCVSLKFTRDNFTSAAIDTLAPYAFANSPCLEEIELPETLVTIGDHAFDNCQNLTSVVFPEGLKSIGNCAFKSCDLTTLILTDNIEEIGDSAFMDCSKVMELKLPSGLKKINPYTFYKCFSGGEFDEKPEENFNLSIEIPIAVESIGDYAFYGCAVNSNKYHGPSNQAYSNIYHYYMYGLLSVSIGENVKTIGAHAFDGCSHLLEVKMGKAVTSIGDYAFNDCFKQRFNGVREVEQLLYGTYGKLLNSYPVVWELDEYTPQPISLPEGLKSIGEGAFCGCAELPCINFPGSLTAIPDQAFNGCKSLSEIELLEGIQTIGDGAFGGCKGVKEISIPASFETGSRVFVDCDSALKVYYHAEDPKAFDEAFFSPKVYSSKESVINAPNALLENMKGKTPWALFYKIVAKDDTLVHLERVLETKNGLHFRVLSNKPIPYCEVAGPAEVATDTISYEVPDFVLNTDEGSEYYGKSYTVIRIGNDAFENDLTLVGITIPPTVFDIGQEAFNGCKNLLEIKLPESITNMGERAFANCYGLTYFEVPPLVTRLNPEVLRDCRGLYSIKMHDNITELGAGALMDCRHLRAFERTENWKLNLIEDYALKNCIELEDINIPEGVTKIGKEVMLYCQKLNTISLPTTLQQLGENTFNDCEVLTTIKVYTEKPPKTIGERHLTNQHCQIYVQAKSLDAYKEFWKMHEHRIEPGIVITIPKREQMPEYIPGSTYQLTVNRPLGGQTMTWSSNNSVVATTHADNDGKVELKAVGRAPIHVETDLRYYHDCELEVYPQLADANWDARLDISDAVNIANYVVENKEILSNWFATDPTQRNFDGLGDWTNFYIVGADVNKDDEISISDASAAVKIVLNQLPSQSPVAAGRLRSISADDRRDALQLFAPEGSTVKVGLDNSKEYVALEAFVRVPEGMTLKNVVAGPRAAAHTLSTRRIDERTMRVVLFDFNNSALAESSESLIELTVEGDMSQSDDIEIFEIIASDITSRSHDLTLRDGGIYTNVDTISDADKYIKTSKDGLIISGAEGMHVAVFTLDGYAIKSFDAASESESLTLPQGIYIVTVGENSSKIVVK